MFSAGRSRVDECQMDTVQGREEVVTRHFEDHSICNPDNSEISAVDLGILVLRVGASPRGWFVEFAEGKKLERCG